MQLPVGEDAGIEADVKTLADKAVEQAMSIALTVDTVRQLSEITTRMLTEIDQRVHATSPDNGPGASAFTRQAQLQRLTFLLADLASACIMVNANLEVSAGVLFESVARIQGAAATCEAMKDEARSPVNVAA